MSNIYVGNLSFKATEDDLRDAFSEFGTEKAAGPGSRSGLLLDHSNLGPCDSMFAGACCGAFRSSVLQFRRLHGSALSSASSPSGH